MESSNPLVPSVSLAPCSWMAGPNGPHPKPAALNWPHPWESACCWNLWWYHPRPDPSISITAWSWTLADRTLPPLSVMPTSLWFSPSALDPITSLQRAPGPAFINQSLPTTFLSINQGFNVSTNKILHLPPWNQHDFTFPLLLLMFWHEDENMLHTPIASLPAFLGKLF